MQKIILAFLITILAGCSTLESLGDYINENEVFTSVMVRQSVSRYIASGDSLEAEKKRALQVETRLERILRYVDGNPKATSAGLMTLIESTIDWDELERADKLLVEDILTILRDELSQYAAKPKLSESTQIALRGLFETAISAARVYLMRG